MCLCVSVALVEKELHLCEKTEEKTECEIKFIEMFAPFVNRSAKLMKVVQDKVHEISKSFDELLMKFGENARTKEKSGEFFGVFDKFVKEFAAEQQRSIRDEEIQGKRTS